MNDIAFFHFYRQDVLSGRKRGKVFDMFARDIKERTIGSVLDHVHALKDYCYGRYTVDEESTFIEDEIFQSMYLYTLKVFGKGGDVGFIFRLCVPIAEENPTRVCGRSRERMFKNRFRR